MLHLRIRVRYRYRAYPEPLLRNYSMRTIAAFCVCSAITYVASGRDIFVDGSAGDDMMRGDRALATSAVDGPVRTITKALRLARPGDRIILSAGSLANRPIDSPEPIAVYRESITLEGERLSGYPTQPLIIEGNGAVLDGSIPVPDEAWQQVRGDLYRFQPARMAYQQLFIDDRPIIRKQSASPAGGLPELQPLEWCLVGGYVYFCVEPTRMPQEYHVTHAGLTVGITLYKCHDVLIRNLTLQGYQLDGINAHDGVRAARLEQIISRGNGRSGVCVTGGSRVELTDSTLGNNGVAQLFLNGYSHTHLFDTQLIEGDAPAIDRHGNDELYIDGELIPASQRSVPSN